MKTKSVFLVIAAVLAAWCLIYGSCRHPDSVFPPAPMSGGYGKIQIITDGEAFTQQALSRPQPRTARTVFPSPAFDHIAYTFTAEGQPSGMEQTPDSGGFFSLEVGSYTVAVSAFRGKAEPYTLAASGVSEPFAVAPGDNQAVTVALSPVAEGYGEFSYLITYPQEATGNIALYSWPGMVSMGLSPSHLCEANGLTEWVELAAGTYLLQVQLRMKNFYAGITEAVHIYPALATVYEKEFTAADFIAVAPEPPPPPPPPPVIGNVKFEYFWVDRHDSLVSTGGGVTTIAVGETLAVTAQDTGYTVIGWYLNGVKSEQNNATFYFTGVTAGNHNVGLLVEKDGKLYNTNITVSIEEKTKPLSRSVTVDMYDSYGNGWGDNAALIVYINGVEYAHNIKVSTLSSHNTPLGQRFTNTFTFSAAIGDVIDWYWVEGTAQSENSFIVYYADTPPFPSFCIDNKGSLSWSGSNALVYKLRYSLSNTVTGAPLGSFIVE